MRVTAVRETFGVFNAEVHFTAATDGTPIAVTRVRPKVLAYPNPLILMHGSYSNRHFWVSPQGVGLAAYLVERGYDVWLPEWRGHGRSKRTEAYGRWTAEDIIRGDYATASTLVSRKTRRQPIWIGHSFGGLFLLAALARGWLPQDKIAAAAVFGSQITHGDEYLRFPPFAWAASQALRLAGRFPARLLRLGPEDEPPQVMAEVIRWKQTGQWLAQDGVDYKEQLSRIQLPIKVFAGAGDTTDPAVGCEELFHLIGSTQKEYTLLGQGIGCRKNYGHVDMIVSKEAADDVWPRLADWLTRIGAAAQVGAGKA